MGRTDFGIAGEESAMECAAGDSHARAVLSVSIGALAVHEDVTTQPAIPALLWWLCWTATTGRWCVAPWCAGRLHSAAVVKGPSWMVKRSKTSNLSTVFLTRQRPRLPEAAVPATG